MSSPLRAAIHPRVSRTEQADNYSLDNQERQCQALATARNMTVVAIEPDEHTGYKMDRPGLNRIRALVRAREVDVVLVWKLDRLTRRMWDLPKLLDEFDRFGVTVVSATEQIDTSTPVGKMTVMALAFQAEQERENIRLRTSTGRRNRAQAGLPIPGSKVPYGYQWITRTIERPGRTPIVRRVGLALDPLTAPIRRRIFEELAQGLTTRGICARLIAEGIAVPSGQNTTWGPATIRYLVSQPFCWGEPAAFRVTNEDVTVEDPVTHVLRTVSHRRRYDESEQIPLPAGVIEPLVSKELAQAALAQLGRNIHTAPRTTRNPGRYLLRGGFVRCAHCGRALMCRYREEKRPARLGKIYYWYTCPKSSIRPGSCNRTCISQGILDAAIWSQVEQVLRDPAIVARAVAEVTGADPTVERRDSAQRRLAEVERLREKAAKKIIELDDEEVSAPLEAQLHLLAGEAKERRTELAALEREQATWLRRQASLDHLEAYCRRVSANVEQLSMEEKRDVLLAWGVEVRVWHGRATKPRWEGRMQPLGMAEPITFSSVTAATNGQHIRA
jgi:site-specific DNA recombinase